MFGECRGERSARFGDESGRVSAVLGTTTVGELLEARPTWLWADGAAEAGNMMAPLINATEGSAEQILRSGSLIVCT